MRIGINHQRNDEQEIFSKAIPFHNLSCFHQDDIASEEDHVEVEKAADGPKTRKTGKRTAK